MSLEQVVRFHDRIAEDQSLQEALDGVSDADLPERLSALGAEHGFAFSADEVRHMMAESTQAAEVSEADLEGVAGGVSGMEGFNPSSGFRNLSANVRTLNLDGRAYPGSKW